MKKHHGLMHGISEAVPHPAEEPIHKGLARGAFAKAAEKYRSGEMGDEEFDGHVHKAHSRLQEPMNIAMPMPSFPTKVSKEKAHKRGKKVKHV